MKKLLMGVSLASAMVVTGTAQAHTEDALLGGLVGVVVGASIASHHSDRRVVHHHDHRAVHHYHHAPPRHVHHHGHGDKHWRKHHRKHYARHHDDHRYGHRRHWRDDD